MLAEFTTWLLGLITKAVNAVFDVVVDALIKVLDLLLGAVVALLSAIPVPASLSAGMQSLWSTLDPGILWVLNSMGLPACLAMLGTAYGFRLIRKVVTLFQW